MLFGVERRGEKENEEVEEGRAKGEVRVVK